ncbi:MAG: NADH-quinone oxidoreductase subunit J [Bacteroidetes bacterium]|nr:NADH-quinone oxidoreductase subunit J [Bacteroidota bacterium]MBM3424559.1 NADH-quinone oxidoreductase subunit J [Bacteroidota bacterium]
MLLTQILGALTVASAIMVVISKHPVRSVLYLVLTFFFISGLYIMMNAQFLAIVNLIVYAGAIMVLFLFVLMMLNLNKETEPKTPRLTWVIAGISAGTLFVVIIAALKDIVLISRPGDMVGINNVGLVQSLGNALFTKYVVPFEISSILFISAMVGAILLAKREKQTID